jgi:hypothetical protein
MKFVVWFATKAVVVGDTGREGEVIEEYVERQ